MYYFRALYIGEDVSNGILAKNPEANIALADFVHSANRGGAAGHSQWVAMTKSFSVVLDNAMKSGKQHCGGIVFIDVDALSTLGIETVDLSSSAEKILRQPGYCSKTGTANGFYRIAASCAEKSAEVDCVPGTAGIPRSMYKFVSFDELKKAYNKVVDPWEGSSTNNRNLMNYLLKIAH